MSVIKLEEISANPVKTNDATLTIEMPGQKLPVGRHTFQLQVEDDSGNVSVPAQVMVIVADTQAPTAVLTLASAEGRPVTNNRITFGSNFILDGKKSLDVGGGNIVSYSWTLVD